jgi:type II secretory pathway predicted ATPase ExeA
MYHLHPLNLEEVQEYLDFRLTIAGGTPGLFTPDAVLRVYELSGGVPRRINQIATNALLVGYGSDAAVIDAALLEGMARELEL